MSSLSDEEEGGAEELQPPEDQDDEFDAVLKTFLENSASHNDLPPSDELALRVLRTFKVSHLTQDCCKRELDIVDPETDGKHEYCGPQALTEDGEPMRLTKFKKKRPNSTKNGTVKQWRGFLYAARAAGGVPEPEVSPTLKSLKRKRAEAGEEPEQDVPMAAANWSLTMDAILLSILADPRDTCICYCCY